MKQIFELDLRALSLARIGLGFILVFDLLVRFAHFDAFYGVSGAVPLSHWLGNLQFDYHYTFYHWVAADWWPLLLLGINLFLAVLLTFGYKTRIVTPILWCFTMALQHRNTLILQGADDYLRLLLFWGMFLPWGKFFSVDSLKNENLQITISSVGSAAFILQVVFMYIFGALMKTSAEWYPNGTALYYALSLDMIKLPLGQWLYQHYNLMKVLTWLTLAIEFLAPIFLLLPFCKGKLKMAAIAVLVFFHVGTALTLYIGWYWAISIVALVAFVPSSIIEKTLKKLKPSSKTEVSLVSTPYKEHYLASSFLLFCTVASLLWNLQNTRLIKVNVPQAYHGFIYTLRLDQYWGMFAPAVFKDDGWYIEEATLTSTKGVIDINTGMPATTIKPAYVVRTFADDRWRKYKENLLFIHLEVHRLPYCHYRLNSWNKANVERQIEYLRVYYMKEVSLDEYKTRPLEKVLLCECRKAPYGV